MSVTSILSNLKKKKKKKFPQETFKSMRKNNQLIFRCLDALLSDIDQSQTSAIFHLMNNSVILQEE